MSDEHGKNGVENDLTVVPIETHSDKVDEACREMLKELLGSEDIKMNGLALVVLTHDDVLTNYFCENSAPILGAITMLESRIIHEQVLSSGDEEVEL